MYADMHALAIHCSLNMRYALSGHYTLIFLYMAVHCLLTYYTRMHTIVRVSLDLKCRYARISLMLKQVAVGKCF